MKRNGAGLRSRVERYGLPLVVALAWLVLGTFRPVFVYDDGIPVVGALRVLEGQLPFRDFYTNYSPGQFYVTAAVFAVFGPSLMAQRLLSVVLRSLLALIGLTLLRRIASPGWSVPLWGLLVLWLGYFGVFGYPGFPALALVLLTVLCAAQHLRAGAEGRGRGWLYATGIAAGVTVLFRQDFGVYVIVAQLVVLAAHAFAARDGHSRMRRLLVEGSIFAAGVVTVLLVPTVVFATALGGKRLLYDLFLWPERLTRTYRGLPYPWPWDGAGLAAGAGGRWTQWTALVGATLPFVVTPVVYLAAGVELLRRARAGWARLEPPDWTRLNLLLVGLLLFNQARIRSDLFHLAPTYFVALLLAGWLLHRWVADRRVWRWPAGAGLALLAVLPALSFATTSLPALRSRPDVASTVPRAGPIRLPQDQAAALHYVMARTAPDEPIYVGTSRHDRVVWNDALFYFLAERPIPTRHHHFDPGLTTTAEVQREIIADLELHRVDHVVLYGGSESRVEPNRSAIPDSRLLDEYLRRRYRRVRLFGAYEILYARDPARARDGGPSSPGAAPHVDPGSPRRGAGA